MLERSLCIIGGGASGIIAAVAARHLKFAHQIKIYEQTHRTGGVWRYGRKAARTKKGCQDMSGNPAMYRDLRSNLPTRLMEVPFLPFPTPNKSASSFVHHSVVMEYLDEVEKYENVHGHVEFGKKVTKVKQLEDQRFEVSASTINSDGSAQTPQTEKFDYVLCCSGSFLVPRDMSAQFCALKDDIVADECSILKQRHIHFSYSHSQSFDHAVELDEYDCVIVVGCGSSGRDIVQMLAEHRHAMSKRSSVAWVPASKVGARYNKFGNISSETLLHRCDIHLCETVIDATRDLVRLQSQSGGAYLTMSVHLVFATGYENPTHPYLATELQPPMVDLLARARENLDPISGFTTVKGQTPKLGFIGYVPVTSPLGMSYWQSAFFYQNAVEVEERTQRSGDGVRPTHNTTNLGPPFKFSAHTELTYSDLLACCAEGSANARELTQRQDMFATCEEQIQTDFLSYREWSYGFSDDGKVQKWKFE